MSVGMCARSTSVNPLLKLIFFYGFIHRSLFFLFWSVLFLRGGGGGGWGCATGLLPVSDRSAK